MTDLDRWFLLTADDLLALLERAQTGDEPALLLLEAHANGNHEPVE